MHHELWKINTLAKQLYHTRHAVYSRQMYK